MYISAREESCIRGERGREEESKRKRGRERASSTARREGSLPKQASVVELNKRRSYQFIMGRHVAHARAYRARPPSPIVSLSLYNGVHASGFREPVYTLTIPDPLSPSPPLPLSLYAAVYLARSIATSPLRLPRLPLSAAVALCLSFSLCGSPVRRDKLNFRSWRVPVGSANREGQSERERKREKRRGGRRDDTN